MANNSEDEARELMALWAALDAERQQREAERARQKLEDRRDSMRAGSWRPGCECIKCVRAVLECRAETACDDTRRSPLHWWW
jgi:hypothetical protein